MNMNMNKIKVMVGALGILCGATSFAAQGSKSITVNVKGVAGCYITANDINFGNLLPSQLKPAAQLSVQPGGVVYAWEQFFDIKVKCSKAAAYTLSGAAMVQFTPTGAYGGSTWGQPLIGTKGGIIKWGPHIRSGANKAFWFSTGATFGGASTSRTIASAGTGVEQVHDLVGLIYADLPSDRRFIPDNYQNSYTVTVTY